MWAGDLVAIRWSRTDREEFAIIAESSKGREGNGAVALWSSVEIVRRNGEDFGREPPWGPSVPSDVEGAKRE